MEVFHRYLMGLLIHSLMGSDEGGEREKERERWKVGGWGLGVGSEELVVILLELF